MIHIECFWDAGDRHCAKRLYPALLRGGPDFKHVFAFYFLQYQPGNLHVSIVKITEAKTDILAVLIKHRFPNDESVEHMLEHQPQFCGCVLTCFLRLFPLRDVKVRNHHAAMILLQPSHA